MWGIVRLGRQGSVRLVELWCCGVMWGKVRYVPAGVARQV